MSYESGCVMSNGGMLSRRSLLALLAAGAGTSALIRALPLAPSVARSQAAAVLRGAGRQVVSIHNDMPYVDQTGRATPYIPPCGTGCDASGTFSLYGTATLRSRYSFI